MRITFNNIPKFQTGNALPQGTKKTGILQFDPNGNNIYYTGDWNGYNTWHASNIVLPWLKNYEDPEDIDWEDLITKGLDSWNDAGGFDWLNATDEQRKHRMTNDAVQTHQQYIIDRLPGLNIEISKHLDSYINPAKQITQDIFNNSASKPNGTDRDFGIHTGNRRPSIHINSDNESTKQWMDYYKNLGYVGAYQYLDHWVPTKDSSKATRPFDENPTEKSSNKFPAEKVEKSPSFWDNLKQAAGKVLNNPDLVASGRLIGNLLNNARVYDEQLKGINPDLLQTYNTYRQVVGDEATKQGYYRRAAQGETKAARPFTSDADRQVAYRNEARRAGNELRAQGDLADNQEIRRTSDESNQHQWANIQRNTEVANTNRAAINKANSAKHLLLAGKHSAQWTSLDNYLQGIEERKRKQLLEDRALEDKIFALQQQDAVYTDEEYQKARKEFQKVVNKYTDPDTQIIDRSSEEYQEALKKWKLAQNAFYVRQAEALKNYRRSQRNTYFLKKGSKITATTTRKTKDDLLYKSVKDSVEHFRKMIKMSSDAQNRKKPKIEKLAPHPKGSTRRYQYGGVAPFTIYKPVALGGETSTSTQESTSSTSSGKSSKEGDGLDLLKKLFENLSTEGLPSDMNSIYASMMHLMNQKELFGEDLSSDDLAAMYIQQMNRINLIKHNKEEYKNAVEAAKEKDALSEYALDDFGRVAVQNVDTGKISFEKIEDIQDKKGKYYYLSNKQLLDLRAYSPDKAFDRNIIEQVVNNGIGMSKIASFLKDNLQTLGSSETTLQGYTKKDSIDIKEGAKLLENASSGEYQYEEYTKNQQKQMEMAVSYLESILPRNMLNVMHVHAKLRGASIDGIIKTLVLSKVDEKYSLKFTPRKSTDNSDGDGSGDPNGDKLKSNPLLQMVQGQSGVPGTWELVTRNSNVKMSVEGMAYSAIPKVNEDMSIDKMLSESGFAAMLNSKQGITFGDQNISPDQLKDVMYSNSGGMIVTLPCKIVNGHKEVNLQVIETFEDAVKEVERQGITKSDENRYYKTLGNVLKNKGLTGLLDAKGYPDKNKFAEFLVVEAYTTDRVKNLNTDSKYIEKVTNPTDELEQRLERALSTDEKKSNYSLDINYWIWGDDVYRGTVFIPLNNNVNAAMNAWGTQISEEQVRNMETNYRNYYDYAEKRSSAKPSEAKILNEKE